MGFDAPKLCVQVKSGAGATDVKVLRELRGVMQDHGADQGLLVSWGGFTRALEAEARRQFFGTRLWDADDVLEMILDNYADLSDETRADLTLKHIWVLVSEEE